MIAVFFIEELFPNFGNLQNSTCYTLFVLVYEICAWIGIKSFSGVFFVCRPIQFCEIENKV